LQGLDEYLAGDAGDGTLERPVTHAAVLRELPHDEPLSCKALRLTGTCIRRLAGRRVAEEWDTTDVSSLGQQLAINPG
jgi:hypothetical protein